MDIYHVNNKFSKYKLYSLTNQIRKSFRTVCSNIGEGYRKCLNEDHFVIKISFSVMKTTKPRFGLIKIARSLDCRLPTEDCRLKNARNNEINHFTQFKLKALNSYVVFIDYPNTKPGVDPEGYTVMP